MTVRVHVTVDGQRLVARPSEDNAHVVVPSLTACPVCKAKAPVQMRAHESRETRRGEYEGAAHALCCDARVGVIVASVPTIFGNEEDWRMTSKAVRARVY